MREYVQQLRAVPNELEQLVGGLSEAQLTTAYIAGEWTVAQNVHHLADSQMLLFMRFKWVLTQDKPFLQPLDQELWARTPDARDANVGPSLLMIRGVHERWAGLITALPDDNALWLRTGHQPEYGDQTLEAIAAYAAQHGFLHIEQIKKTLP